MAAGFDASEYTLYALRQLVVNELNIASLTHETRHHAVGHGIWTSTFFRDYISKRNTADVQDIVMRGQENHLAVAAHGLRRAAAQSRVTLAEELAATRQRPHHPSREMGKQRREHPPSLPRGLPGGVQRGMVPQSSPPTALDVSLGLDAKTNTTSTRKFWKPLCTYLTFRRQKTFTVESFPLRTLATVVKDLQQQFSAFHRKRHRPLEQTYPRPHLPKAATTPQDLRFLLKDGISFSS